MSRLSERCRSSVRDSKWPGHVAFTNDLMHTIRLDLRETVEALTASVVAEGPTGVEAALAATCR